eukprot:5775099-Alexandrium_andersonii.AAC.1
MPLEQPRFRHICSARCCPGPHGSQQPSCAEAVRASLLRGVRAGRDALSTDHSVMSPESGSSVRISGLSIAEKLSMLKTTAQNAMPQKPVQPAASKW